MELLLTVIVVTLFAGYAVLIIYYRRCWQQIPDYQPTKQFNKNSPAITNENNTTKITIIIPARNEEQHIGHCLQSIIQQTYPPELFEVIVVDDHSTDSTAAIVQSFAKRNIHCIFLKDFVTDHLNSYKKKAIETAITQSTGDLIVTTDADCFMGNNWLQTIASFYETYKPAFIAAPVSINCDNRFLAIFQALDFMTLQGITGASVYKKIHSMCNGANLAYEKIVFDEVGGFKGIDNIASGDDMLLMHKIYQRYPDRVLYLKSKEAIVQTQPMDTWKNFFNQRIRWASKADKYDDKRILGVLILVYFFNLLLLLLPVIALFHNFTLSVFNYQSDSYRISIITYWLLLLVFKTLVELFFLFPVAVFFDNQSILWWFPLAQPFHILYTIVAGWLGKFGSYTWKSRMVK
jgi:cellulose synthase/poly-beta-1,6-N-acetylglucosamine synthase-like glycosyltransferase